MNKNFFSLILTLAVLTLPIFAEENAPTYIEDIPTVQAFKPDAVPQADIERIVRAGINSQSGLNKQPWHFSVITNAELMNQIADELKANMPKGMPALASAKPKANIGSSPVAIVVSSKDGSEFDAGLACQLIATQAFALGYGSKIVSSTSFVLNGPKQAEYRKLLGIPEDMSAKAVVLVGKFSQEESDAVTSATPRKPAEETVTYIR